MSAMQTENGKKQNFFLAVLASQTPKNMEFSHQGHVSGNENSRLTINISRLGNTHIC
jgi:hypothetical protein